MPILNILLPTASGQPGTLPPGTHWGIGANVTYCPGTLQRPILIFEMKCNNRINTFTKCSPFSRINWFIPIILHFKIMDDGTIFFSKLCTYTYSLYPITMTFFFLSVCPYSPFQLPQTQSLLLCYRIPDTHRRA